MKGEIFILNIYYHGLRSKNPSLTFATQIKLIKKYIYDYSN